MPAWQSDYVQTNGMCGHYTRTGGDRPPVVLAHGYCDDGLCWTPVARALEADYDLVLVDARGHGYSDAPEQDFDPSTMADDLAGVISALSLRSPIVVGHSMGGATTLILAGRHPELLRGIVLEDPTPWWPPSDEPLFNPAWRAEAHTGIAGRQGQGRQAIIAAQQAERPQWSLAELEPWAEAKLRFSLSFLQHVRPPALDWPDLARRITCPALLITGEPALGSAVTDRQAMALGGWVPQLTRAHIPGAGHNVRRDRLEVYLAVMRPQLAAWTSQP